MMINLGSGDYSKELVRELHAKLDEALIILGGVQQPSMSTDSLKSCSEHDEQCEIAQKEIRVLAGDIYCALTGEAVLERKKEINNCMRLTKVTFTGVDDKTSIHEMKRLSESFPFIEWGVLFSKSRAGTPRYPSQDWIENLFWYAQAYPNMHLSAHICGKWMRNILLGDGAFASRFGYLIDFERTQINCHGKQHEIGSPGIDGFKRFQDRHAQKFIIPYEDMDTAPLFMAMYSAGVDIVPLFDASEGRGTEPLEWPISIPSVENGYSGGLNPGNLEKNLPEIAEAAVGADVWIDMETGVRSTDNRFDFSKVLRCVEIIVKLADKGDILIQLN